MAQVTLGKRLNNPLNVRYSKDNNWLGQIGSYRGFCEFESSDYGFRAAMLLLERYIVVFHLRSVRSIITRFAPGIENNTSAYIRYIETSLRRAGYDYDDIKPYTSQFYHLVSCMSFYESKFDVDLDYLRDLVNKFHLDS